MLIVSWKSFAILSCLAFSLFSASAQADPATVYVKTVSGQLVEVPYSELLKANQSAGLQCTSASTNAPSSQSCVPAFGTQGYSLMMGSAQISGFLHNQSGVISAYQQAVLRGTCTVAPASQTCNLQSMSGDQYLVMIGDQQASDYLSLNDAFAAMQAYQNASICH